MSWAGAAFAGTLVVRSGSTWGAVVCVASAVLLVTWRPGRRVDRPGTSAGSRRVSWSIDAATVRHGWLFALAVPGVLIVAVGPPSAVLLVLLVAASVLVVLRRREADALRVTSVLTGAVAELATALAADLTAGHAPLAALRALADEGRGDLPPAAGRAMTDAVEAVVRTSQLGGDVPAALRQRAARRGLEGLVDLAAGWAVAEASGAALASVLDQVAGGLRDRLAAERTVTVALAGARSSARLLAGLPLIGLAMGAGLGLSPVDFLLGTIVGRGCLLVGLGLEVAGLVWTDALASAALRRP